MTDTKRSEALWASALQAVANHVAHDFRNALNGVAVNLEVVRGRAARGAESSAIAPFASTAAAQFEGASAAGEALLGLARSEPTPADVAAIAGRLVRLLSLRDAAAVRLVDQSSGLARSPINPDLVRAVVARSVLAAVGSGDGVACEISVGDGIFLLVTGTSHLPPLDPELVTVATDNGVRITNRENRLELRFPALDERATPHVPE